MLFFVGEEGKLCRLTFFRIGMRGLAQPDCRWLGAANLKLQLQVIEDRLWVILLVHAPLPTRLYVCKRAVSCECGDADRKSKWIQSELS